MMDIVGRQVQIGVVGSSSDLEGSDRLPGIADLVGRSIARRGAVLVCGLEADRGSLPMVAAQAAKSEGGLTVGIAYGKDTTTVRHLADVVITTGLERGGGREFVLVLSCDALLAIGGGSGTLGEIAIAYQAGIPIVATKGSGGWSDKLLETYLDERRRLKAEKAVSGEEAVSKAIELTRSLVV